MKIVRTDQDGHRRTIADNLTDKVEAAKHMIDLAYAEAEKLPNDPTVTICGIDEISIRITYTIATYKLVE